MNTVVVITGASSGLGLSLAKRFLRDRDHVFGISKTKRHWKTALSETGKAASFSLTELDATRESSVSRYLKAVLKKAGKIDIVINNAGYSGALVPVDGLSVSEVSKHFKQNLLSAFVVSKNALPILKKQSKSLIINISSMAGKRAVPGLFAYSASKFGILALSQCVAKENRNSGLSCVTVCPGGINTEMRAKIFGKSDAQKQQTPDFVADIIFQITSGQIKVESGGDVVIRHGKITAINPSPDA
jgi:NAD(P)-dependent dehydrogenase (short-subunit alcohol dehydrogenase family)